VINAATSTVIFEAVVVGDRMRLNYYDFAEYKAL
jgi:hypothetical protein